MSKIAPTKDQKKAKVTIDRNVSVSAGAGSGKTRVLVERFLYILEKTRYEAKPVIPEEILAITFTRKAAGEMKEKLYDDLRDMLASEIDEETGKKIDIEFWQQVMNSIEQAPITTIHGLCNRLLKENPVEAALDPGFQVAEEYEYDEYIRICVRDFLQKQLKDKNVAMQTLCNTYGIPSIISQIVGLANQLDEISNFKDFSRPYVANIATESMKKSSMKILLYQLLDFLPVLGKKTKGAQKLLEMSADMPKLEQELSEDSSSFPLLEYYLGKDGLGARGKIADAVKAAKEVFNALLIIQADKKALEVISPWQEVLSSFYQYLNQRKEKDAVLGFDDLERLAIKLLRENADVRHKYQNKFRYIMVDEFQDTNESQRKLIYLLCGESSEVLEGNKLFIVGDPKQSIYRFRGADVSVFKRVRDEVESKGGVSVKLRDNFRSVDKILDACNHLFPQLMGEDEARDVFYESLVANRKSEVLPEFLKVSFEKEENKSLARYYEAAAIARNMLAKSAKGEKYSDMTVLVRAMTNVDILTDVFRQFGIPYVVADGRDFYERQEVIDVLHLLTILHNKHRNLELVGVLRSPYFGIDDETITRLFLQSFDENSCLWDTLMAYKILDDKDIKQQMLLRARNLLFGLRKDATYLGLTELLNSIDSVLNVRGILALQEDGEVKLANVKKLFGIAKKFSIEKHGTLKDWNTYVEELRAAEVRETAANINVGDSVEIMTIHKSKGLDFKTVYLPQLDSEGPSDMSVIRFDEHFGLGIQALMDDGRLLQSSVLKDSKERDKLLENEERHRLLYVAMTRAKNNLVMSGVFKNGGTSTSDNWFNTLWDAFPEDENGIVNVSMLIGADQMRKDAGKGNIDITTISHSDIAPIQDFDANGQEYFTASHLQAYLHCPRQYFYQRGGLPTIEVEAENTSGILPASTIGSLLHRALELYDGSNADAAFDEAMEEIPEANVTNTIKARQMMMDYISSNIFKAMPAEKMREVNFNFQLEEFFFSGIIDCLYNNPDGTVSLVDYKTGKAPEKDELKLGYAYQLALYKFAVEKMGKEVKEAKLHFLQNLSEWALPLEDDFLEEALKLSREISKNKDEQDFACTCKGCNYCTYSYLCPQK